MPGTSQIIEILSSFTPIFLEEMDNVRLMDRVDTKYILSVSRLPDIMNRMNGSYKVLDINKERSFRYDTTYLDNSDFIFFSQHVTGKLERNKVRFRKYETTGTTYLEVKKRTNKNRTKKWRIENMLIDNSVCDINAIEFIKEYIPLNTHILKPVLTNTFKRITFVGSAFNERITVDYDLSYTGLNGNRVSFPFIAIIELKREGFSDRSQLEGILKDYLIRPVGFSKYCIGSGTLYDLPHKNILKPKFLLINKLQNEFNRRHTV
jgi:hypothetical protein